MRILSMYFGHDSSICLFEDGQVAWLAEKERLEAVKHASGPMDIQSVLDSIGWSLQSVDLVVLNPTVRIGQENHTDYWEMTGKSYIERSDYMAPFLRASPDDRYSMHDIHIEGRTIPCIAIDHHLAHAATGYYTSPFDEATIVTADAGGDGRSAAIARAEGKSLVEIEYGWGTEASVMGPNIGRVWGTIGETYFGYRRLEAAGKLMGLAPYGHQAPQLVDALEAMARSDPRNAYPIAKQIRPRQLSDQANIGHVLAASLQGFTTKLMLDAATYASELYPSSNLVISGGCALNCVANTALHDSGIFAKSWVPAQPGDSGLALGQALFVWHHVLQNPRTHQDYSRIGTDVGHIRDIDIDRIITSLQEGRTVGLFDGKAESGPRALGNRSIVADPRRLDVRDVINETLKFREWFRPLAPMVLEEDYTKYFVSHVPSLHMSYTTQVRSDNLPAVRHVDGSTRPQIVSRTDPGIARRVLEAWKQKTGHAVLLNTSLNSRGPIVETLSQAHTLLEDTSLDVLASKEGIAEHS